MVCTVQSMTMKGRVGGDMLDKATIEEVRKAMVGMSTEELMLWVKHVEHNPYRVGDISEKVREVLSVEIMCRKSEERL